MDLMIQICIDEIDNLKDLYEVKGDYYIRREGGKTEPMKPKDVQQWYRHVCEIELQKKDEERNNILYHMDKPTGKNCVIM